jgi:hypothetical protein
MLPRTRFAVIALVGAGLFVGAAHAAGLSDSLKQGTPDLKSAGPLAFGPEGILFVGDSQGAAIFAIDTGDHSPAPAGPFKVPGIDEKIASLLGTDAKQILLNGLAVNPASGNAYLSVARGKGPDASAVLVRVDRQGKIEELPLKDVKYAKATLSNAPGPEAKDKGGNLRRRESITGLAYVDGRVIVAGLSNEEFASKLRTIPFPFKTADRGTSVEIYHGSHGRLETASPVRTLTTYDIKGETNILAAYTCTPLVKFPVSDLKPGQKVRGTTVAELGNRNVPLDMIVYQKDGKDYVLMANNSRGVMKISTDNIDKIEGITSRISDKAGLHYETIKDLQGVLHLAKLDKDQALLLVRANGSLNLESTALP